MTTSIETTRSPRATNRRRRTGAALSALALLLAGCSGGGDESFDSASEPIQGGDIGFVEDGGADEGEVALEADSDAATDEAVAPEGGTTTATDAEPTTAAPLDIGRSIVFTGSISVEVDDVATAGAEAVDSIEGIGGFVFGQASTGGVEPTSTYTFKVAPDQFNEALELLAGVGELRNQTITADDVTERVVDLDSRIEVAELGVERLRAALEESTTFEDYAQIETLLLQRESELEVMRGQSRTLADQVAMATITLTLTQDRTDNAIDVLVTTYEGHDGGTSCPGESPRRLESGSELTVCFELVNIGDQDLADLNLVDSGLDIDEIGDLTLVFGDLDQPLPPGQSVFLAHESKPDRSLRLRTRVSAQPQVTDDIGDEPAGPSVSTLAESDITVIPGEEVAGFGDGFDAGTNLIAVVWSGIKVVAGFLIPMLVLLPVIAAIVVLWRRRPRRQKPPTPAPVMPPPPVTESATVAPAGPQPKSGEGPTEASPSDS